MKRKRVPLKLSIMCAMPHEVKSKSLHRQRFTKLDKVIHKDVITMFNRLGTHVSDNVLPETGKIVFEPVRVIKSTIKEVCVTVGFTEKQRPVSGITEYVPIKKVIDVCTTTIAREMPFEEKYNYI